MYEVNPKAENVQVNISNYYFGGFGAHVTYAFFQINCKLYEISAWWSMYRIYW